MKDSEILKKVKKRIASGKDRLICFAISHVVEQYGVFEAEMPLLAWIRTMLKVHNTYGMWLIHTHRNTTNVTDSDILEGRLAWLDWMIAYCENEEAQLKGKQHVTRI